MASCSPAGSATGRAPTVSPRFPSFLWTSRPARNCGPCWAMSALLIHLYSPPDGRTLIAADSDRHTIRFWDPANGKEQRRIKVEQNDRWRTLVLSRDGKILAGAGARFRPATRDYEAAVWLWDADSGK